MATHEELLSVCKYLSSDYEPYGKLDRGENNDCSCGCKFYHVLEGELGMDWGTCTNPQSHRKGLLTFEHQGCPEFEPEENQP